MEYKLIAFDMEGTLLNSNKQISKKTQEAIARAVAYNKIVILNTGRNSAELEKYLLKINNYRKTVLLTKEESSLSFQEFNIKKYKKKRIE